MQLDRQPGQKYPELHVGYRGAGGAEATAAAEAGDWIVMLIASSATQWDGGPGPPSGGQTRRISGQSIAGSIAIDD